jgi:hypothetical protein
MKKRGNPGNCQCCPAGGGTVSLCICPAVPTTLAMTATPVGTADATIFHDATLAYGPTDPGYAGLALGANGVYSTASFVDQNGDTFQYYLFCTRNQFFLTRIYKQSVFGSPFQDSVRFFWTVVGVNTCSPFSLTTGTIYSGGNAGTRVQVHG